MTLIGLIVRTTVARDRLFGREETNKDRGGRVFDFIGVRRRGGDGEQ